MCKVQMLTALVKQRLTAAAEEIFGLFERTIAEYEEELSRSKEENERQQKLLDAVFNPQLQLNRADVQQLLVVKEEVPPEQQEWSSSPDLEDPEPPHIKEEQEELWTSQEGEQLHGLEEADITKFTFTPVPVKSEDDEEKPQFSQFHQRLTKQMEIEADGEDGGGPEPARNSDPGRHREPDTDDKTRDSSEPVTDHSEVPVSDSRSSAGEKLFVCSECDKRFAKKGHLNQHMKIHKGEKPFSCLVCEKRFLSMAHLKSHIVVHTGEKRFSCSLCNKRFAWRHQVKQHKCVSRQSSQLQSQTEQMETEVDGEDFGGPGPARNSDPDRHAEPDTDDKTGDSFEPETDDGWKETREPQSCLNSFNNHEVPVSVSRCSAGEKPFSCSLCGKGCGTKRDLKVHMRSHTGEKPHICSFCKKSFTQSGNLRKHIRIHTGEKPFSCLVCGKRFLSTTHLKSHMVVHTSEKPFSCSLCNKRFAWCHQVKAHKCVVRQSSQLHQSQTDQTETEADLEDSGGSEPARNSDPDTIDKTGDSYEPEADNGGDWKKSREPQSDLNSLNNHEDEKTFSCSLCGKRFGTKRNLNVHVRSHTGERPFSCSFCMKTFTQSGNLRSHIRIHTGEKPFSCSVCDKRFLSMAHLKSHMVVHTSEKPFSCSVCNKRFARCLQVKQHKCVGRQSSQFH